MTDFRTKGKGKNRKVYPIVKSKNISKRNYQNYKFTSEYEKRLARDRKENLPLFKKREKEYNQIKGIRVGDWVKEKNGDFSRVTYIWRDEKGKPFQIQTGGQKHSSFYLGDGYMSYSGSLEHGFEPDKEKVVQLKDSEDGLVWFFRNDYATAHNSVEYMMKFRVFKVM